MTTPTLPKPAHTHAQGVTLLHQVVGSLLSAGYTRQRVDTLVDPGQTRTVRHHYTAGEWTLTVTTDLTAHTLRYSIWATMPTEQQLLQDIRDVPTRTPEIPEDDEQRPLVPGALGYFD